MSGRALREGLELSPDEAHRLDAGALIIHRDERGVTAYKAVPDVDGVVAYGPVDPRDVTRDPRLFVLAFLLELSFYMTAVALVVFPLYRRLTRLQTTARQIADGDFEARVAVTSGDAVGELGRSFNEMAKRVQELLQTQRELTRAVSHELRTPIARLRFAIEEAASEPDDAARAAQLRDMDHDIVELDALVEELLTYTRLNQAPESPLQLERVELRACLSELVSRPPVARGKRIALECGEGVTLRADRKYLLRAVQNLLGNGLRHARERVQVSCEVDDARLRIFVDDDGPGIPAGDRQRVFDPFVRLEDSRDRATGGAGLGLAIVARISTWHGGHVHADESPLGGARFVLDWPLARESAEA